MTEPKMVVIFLGGLIGLAVLVWFIRKIRARPNGATDVKTSATGGLFSNVEQSATTSVNADLTAGTNVMGAHAAHGHGPTVDVGRDTFRLLNCPKGQKSGLVAQNIDVSLNLPAAVTPPGPFGPLSNPEISVPIAVQAEQTQQSLAQQRFFNSDDVNIDPQILRQWTLHEIPYQENTTGPLGRNGQFWAKNWEAWGPLDPFTPRHLNEKGHSEVTPGPMDPQLAFASALTASMDEQAEKFQVSENPNDITLQYRNSLQQLPGSHFETFAASWNAHDTPMVVERRAHLPQMAARWVVMQLNEKLRKEHPCFSLSGREHFELSNPPQNCGDTANQKQNPITLIRVFESRLMKVSPPGPGCESASPGPSSPLGQILFLTMEIGNHISAGSGGMFHTQVTIDDKGNFVHYTDPQRDEKQTFVLPRTR